jgi:hypothetical protein
MNIAKHMEAIFVAAVFVLGGINLATAKAVRPPKTLSPALAAPVVDAAESSVALLDQPYLVIAANL